MTATLSKPPKTDKPLTKTEWEKRQKRTNLMISKLTEQYVQGQDHILGRAPGPQILLTIEGVNLDPLWSELHAATTHLGDHEKVHMDIQTTGKELVSVTFGKVQNNEWPACIQELQNHLKDAQKRHRKFKDAILQVTIWKPTPDTRTITDDMRNQASFAAAIAGSAAHFMAWCGGDMMEAKFPSAYPQTRLQKAVSHLQSQPLGMVSQELRTTVLNHLRKLWASHRDLIDSWDALHGGTETWNEENPDQDAKVQWNLPLWPSSAEGKVIETWDCFSGTLIFINRSLGLKLLDLEDKDSQTLTGKGK